MIDELININPVLYNKLMEKLEKTCIMAEKRYATPDGSFGFRIMQPDDPNINGTYNQYSYVFENDKEAYAFVGNNNKYSDCRTHVPIGNMWFYFGWKCKIDFGGDSLVKVIREGIVLRKIPTSIIFEQQNPLHTYYDMQGMDFFWENDMVEFKIVNNSGADAYGEVYPILYRIAPKMALNQFKNARLDDVNWTEIPRNMDVNKQKEYFRLDKIEQLLGEMKEMYRPFDYVEVKDNPFTSHVEMRSRLDPSMKNYLENLKNGKVCPYCGEMIFSNSRFCFACGSPINYEKEKEQLFEELNVKNEKNV